MNPILLILIILYLVIVLSKNVLSNKEISQELPLIIANTILFIREYLEDIFITIFIMLFLIAYFAVIGIDLNAKTKKHIEKTVIIEKFTTKTDCSKFDDSNTCKAHPKCGWCTPSNKCINVSISGRGDKRHVHPNGNPKDCSTIHVKRTGKTNCPHGNMKSNHFSSLNHDHGGKGVVNTGLTHYSVLKCDSD